MAFHEKDMESNMKYRQIIVVLYFLTAGLISPLTLRAEKFYVHNNSDRDIVITIEFYSDPSSPFPSYLYDIKGVPVVLMFYDSLQLQLEPHRKAIYISYRPLAPIEEILNNQYYEKLEAVPILEKLKLIFKSFVILDTKGQVLLTLDDIKEHDIVRTPPPYDTNIYTLEFYLPE
jgi:hypothetical protein